METEQRGHNELTDEDEGIFEPFPEVEGYEEMSLQEEVYLKVLPRGEKMYKDLYHGHELHKEKNGLVKMQLARAMQIFGSAMILPTSDVENLPIVLAVLIKKKRGEISN